MKKLPLFALSALALAVSTSGAAAAVPPTLQGDVLAGEEFTGGSVKSVWRDHYDVRGTFTIFGGTEADPVNAVPDLEYLFDKIDAYNAGASADAQYKLSMIAIGTARPYIDGITNGTSYTVFDGLSLANAAGSRAGRILITSSNLDRSPNRNQTVLFKNSAIRGWNISVEGAHSQKGSTVSDHRVIQFVNSTFEGDIYNEVNTLVSGTYDRQNDVSISMDGTQWTGRLYNSTLGQGPEACQPNGGCYPTTQKLEDNAITQHQTKLELKNGSSWHATGASGVSEIRLDASSWVEVSASEPIIDDLPALNIGLVGASGADASEARFVLNQGASLGIKESEVSTLAFDFRSLDVAVEVGQLNEGSSLQLKAAEGLNDGRMSASELALAMFDKVESDAKSAEFTVAEGLFADGASGTISAPGADGESPVVSVSNVKRNTNSAVVAEATGAAVMQWRAEMNDMGKRMGELRGLDGSAGLWVRTIYGKSEYGSQNVENQFKSFQFGADKLLARGDAQTWAGLALSYTDGDADFSTGSGNLDTYALTAYASTLFANGSFLDASLKYGRISNDLELRAGSQKLSGDYTTNAFSVTVEAGHRFTFADRFFAEPQVEFMYSHVADERYGTGLGTAVDQDSIDFKIARAGVEAGLNLPEKRGNVYVRASYLYDFDAETTTKFYQNGNRVNTFDGDFGGDWYELGVGANLFATEALRFYADFEYTGGGVIKTPYRWNLGMRYTF